MCARVFRREGEKEGFSELQERISIFPSSRMSSPLAPPVNSEALLQQPQLRVNLFIGYHYKIPEL